MRGSGQDASDADRDVWPLVIAASNQDLALFKYFWEMHYLWDSSHLYAILEILFIKTKWRAALMYLFKSKTTEDIIFTFTYEERESFAQELFRRFIGNSTEKMTKGLFEKLLETPFTVIGLKGLLESCALNPHFGEVEKIWHTKLIKQCTAGLSSFDWAEYKYRASPEFHTRFETAMKSFETCDFPDSKKLFRSLEKRIEKIEEAHRSDPVFESEEHYEEGWTEIHTACREGDKATLEAKLREMKVFYLIQMEDDQEFTPLKNRATKALDGQEKQYYWNALLIAIKYGHMEVVKFLMEECRVNL